MSMRERADAVLGESVSTDALPGVAAGATNRDGDLYLGGLGERVLGSGEEMTPDTVGWIASMTKAITTAAAMQLVEQGRLELDAPASEVAPGLGDTAVLEGFDGDGNPRTRPPRRPITLRHLLTHTSGFVYDIWNESMVRYQEATGTPRHHRMQGCMPHDAARLRPGRALGLRDRHRLGGEDGRGGERTAARGISP